MKKKSIKSKKGNLGRLRLSVFRSNVHISAQLIDDFTGTTLVEASSLKLEKDSKVNLAKSVGMLLAKKAKEKNLAKVFFDRGRYQYKGRVKALAESARENGLDF